MHNLPPMIPLQQLLTWLHLQAAEAANGHTTGVAILRAYLRSRHLLP